MHKEKLPRKKKESASENKENQEPNINPHNKTLISNKNVNSLKIQIESRNQTNQNNFLNSEKDLNLNSRDNNLNLDVIGLENAFDDNSLKNQKENKRSFLCNNSKNNLDLIANSLQMRINPSPNAPNEDVYLSQALPSNKILFNNFKNDFNFHAVASVNPNEFLEASAKVNNNFKDEDSKISDFIFLKKKLTRDDVAKIKHEFLDGDQKLKIKKHSKKSKHLNEKKKALSQKNCKFHIDHQSNEIAKEANKNELSDNLQFKEPNAFEENFSNNNNLNLDNRSKPLKNFFDTFLSQDDPFIQAAKIKQINNINSNLFRINQKSRINCINANQQPSHLSASNDDNINLNINSVLKQSDSDELIDNFNFQNKHIDFDYLSNPYMSRIHHPSEENKFFKFEQNPISIRKNFIENSYQILQKGFNFNDNCGYKNNSNNAKQAKNKGKYAFNLISNPPSIVKGLSKRKNNNKIFKNLSACEKEILPTAAEGEGKKENICFDKDKNNTKYSILTDMDKAVKHDSIPEEEKMQISDSSNNNYNRHKYWVKTRSQSSKGSSRKCKLFAGLPGLELNPEIEKIKKKLVFPFKSKSRSKGDFSGNNSDDKKNENNKKSNCLEALFPEEIKRNLCLDFKDFEKLISNKKISNNFIESNKGFKKALFRLSSLPLVISQESEIEFTNQNRQRLDYINVIGERCLQIKQSMQQEEIAILNPFISRSKMNLTSEIDQKSKENYAYKFLLEKINIHSLKSKNEFTNRLNSKHDINFNCNGNLKHTNILSNYFQNSAYSAIKKYLERRKSINLEITKSNVSLGSINTNFIVTKDGLASSQRSKGNDHISIGRQQINDDGIRPNDIMLFPTDPSISRSHLKVFYKGFFTEETLFFEKLQVLLNLLYVDKRRRRSDSSQDANGEEGKRFYNTRGFFSDFNLDKEEKQNFGKAISHNNFLGYGSETNFDCKNACFYGNNEKLMGEDMGFEFDFDAYFAKGNPDKDEFITEYEDKKKSESLFIKNFFVDENNNKVNNDEEFWNGEKEISKNENNPNSKSPQDYKASEELFNSRYSIPLIKFPDDLDDAVSSFVEIPNADNNVNNKIQVESMQPAKQNTNIYNNYENNKVKNNNNSFEIPFNRNKNHLSKTNIPKKPNNKSTSVNYPNYLLKITPLVIQDIIKYLLPKEEVFIEDNSTIYGTYVRIKPYSVDNLISNIYLIYSCLNVYNTVNNFSFENALHVLLNNEKDFKKIGAELFKDFTSETSLKDKDANKRLTTDALNPQTMDLAIKIAEESKGIMIKECNADNYVFYNVENMNLLESMRRKYLFEKNEDNILNKNKSNNRNNNTINSFNEAGFGLNIKDNFNIINKNNFPNNFLRNEKSNIYNKYYDDSNYDNNNNKSSNFIFSNDHFKNNKHFAYFSGNCEPNLNNNPIKNEQRILSEYEENYYGRQNTDFGLDYLKEKFKNLTLKEPKALIYTYDLNLGKCLEKAMLNNFKYDDDGKIEAPGINDNNRYNERAAKENCLVSAYTQKNCKKSERLNNKCLENELFLLFLNKKKIDFLLRNFSNEAFNPYNADSLIVSEINSTNYLRFGFNDKSSITGVIRPNAFDSNNYTFLEAGNKKDLHEYADFYFMNNKNNPNSNTIQKQQQNCPLNSITSFNNNYFNQITLENNANNATNDINNLPSLNIPIKTRSLSYSAKPVFNSSNYPSSEFLNFFFENSKNQFSNRNKSFNYLTRFYCENLAFLESHIAANQNSKQTSSLSSLSKLFNESNFILKSERVFLNSAKSGFIVSKIGCFDEILKTIKFEHQEFFNAETQSGKIEFISFDKFFEFQKLDLNSREFKGEIDKNLVLNAQGIFQKSVFSKEKSFENFEKNKNDFSFLYLIETSGDPCGIMNRQREIIFIASKIKKIENQKIFAFNNRPGFLLGNEINCSVFHRDWEAQAYLAYDPIFDKWIVSDLTCFLKPSVFYSKDYHGLWMCVSPDKRSINRFSPVKYGVKSGDEIKVSETVVKVDFEYRC